MFSKMAFREEQYKVTLSEASVGDKVRVVSLNIHGPIRRRIMDMGITKGVVILVKRLAPLGDPMELVLRGYSLSVRKEDASFI